MEVWPERVSIVDDVEELALQLLEDGYCMVPLLAAEELAWYNSAMQRMFDEFPECTPGNKLREPLIHGMSGCLGNPGAFHHPLLRRLRKLAMEAQMVVMGSFCEKYKVMQVVGKRPYFELLADRVCVRIVGVTNVNRMRTGKPVHRDSTLNAKKVLSGLDSLIFGGWLNLNLCDQEFGAVRGTQLYDGVWPDAYEIADPSAELERLVVYPVPPGHLLIFHQNIIHTVMKWTQPEPMLRMFVGCRLSGNNKPLFSSRSGGSLAVEKCMLQAPMRIKSGLYTPMYSYLKLFHDAAKLSAWSVRIFKDPVLKQFHHKGGDENYRVVESPMRGLVDSGLQPFPAYTTEELAMYEPLRRYTFDGRCVAL